MPKQVQNFLGENLGYLSHLEVRLKYDLFLNITKYGSPSPYPKCTILKIMVGLAFSASHLWKKLFHLTGVYLWAHSWAPAASLYSFVKLGTRNPTLKGAGRDLTQ